MGSWAFTAPERADAQEPAECSTPEHRQFDFWIGDWEVTDSLGQRLGTSRITATQGGCLIEESWLGSTGSRGHSVSEFDPADNKWLQTWSDDDGTVLRLAGGFINGEMVLEGERRLADGTETLERITWTPNADGTVRQTLLSSPNRGMRWTTVTQFIYRKRGH